MDLDSAPGHPSAERRSAVSRIAGWLGRDLRGSDQPLWMLVFTVLLAAVVLLPIVTMVILGLSSSSGIWSHLLRNVLPQAVYETVVLMIGVGALTLVIGTTAAWLVTMYRFPGREIIDRLLILPLAVPTYIMAYCYVELLDSAGPLQMALRDVTGWKLARDYWFPEIRSMGGAVFVLSAALYPYVYLSARAAFVQQSICALEVARTLGRNELGALWAVALPMARPALIAGVSLALMECLNDIGAVEYLGVQTLTASVYATWLERESLGGAAQIASIMLLFVFALFILEQSSRGDARFHQATGRYRPITFARLHGWRGIAATVACGLPLIFGFILPCLILLENALSGGFGAVDGRFTGALGHSLELATIAAIATVAIGLALAFAQRTTGSIVIRRAVGLAGLGYAVPGTILALGLLIPLAGLDNWLNRLTLAWFGISLGQLFAGTLITLIVAYVIRFAAISLGAIDAGLQRISPHLDAAARTLGETRMSVLWRIHLPLLLPAIGAAALMVFVDTMKELPATLLLQPFNVETLATFVYGKADAYEFEDAAVAALTIVVVGLLPVLLLHRTIARGRPGDGSGN